MVIHRLYVVGFFVISVLCASALLPLIVNAQNGMGAYGLNLNPSSGPAGTKVQVSLTIPSTDAYLYRDKTFSLVWDIGGWNQDNPTDWNTVQTAKWNIIGTATWDISGHLTGTATIPQNASNQIGHHVLYAIYEVQGESNLMNFYWGFFEITTETPITPTPTPTPTNAPTVSSPTPIPTPRRGPGDNCTLTISYDNDECFYTISPYPLHTVPRPIETPGTSQSSSTTDTLIYQYDSDVTITTSSNSDSFTWANTKIVYPDRHIENAASETFSLTIQGDIHVTISYNKRSEIPGFPFESIFIGLFLALGLLYLTKRKLTINRPMPT